MSEHRYILEPYKGMNTRYRCPSCKQGNKTFVRYINIETGEHIHPSVGRCNRESKCGYHYTPKQYFQDNNISFDTPKAYKPKIVTPQPKPVSFIPVEIFKASLKGHETNNFVKRLIDLFGVEVTGELVSHYFIGTSKHWKGATVFWQIDTQGRVRTGKIMLYSPSTGKRIKEPFNHLNWAHSMLKQPNFRLKQCLFGEHLLIDKTKPVALVESEKTAVIASVYLPQFIWLAVGGLANLNAEKCSILKGRTVALFPDLGCFDKWNSKAKELSDLAIFTVSDLLERKATEAEKEQGLDLADYLERLDLKTFIDTEQKDNKINIKPLAEVNAVSNYNTVCCDNILDSVPTRTECSEITELESYFNAIDMPTQPIKLNPYTTIINVPLFIESHLATVKANNGKSTFLPYLNRLQTLKLIM